MTATALASRLRAGAIGALDLLCVYLGDRLGLYRVLAERPGSTPSQLAKAAGVHERYAREWLEHQPEKISADCPHCGYSQLESALAKSTICRQCSQYFSIEKLLAISTEEVPS